MGKLIHVCLILSNIQITAIAYLNAQYALGTLEIKVVQPRDFFLKNQIPHASVVLKEDVRANNGSPLEPKNPLFDEMMNAVYQFQKQHL